MRQTVMLCLLVLAIGVPAFAQRSNVPTFRQYPANIERKTARSIDFRNSPGARTFRTRLTQALRGNVNFAGRYIVAGWGCGTGCIYAAVIDARTGRVYFPEQLAGVAVGLTPSQDYVSDPITYRRDSRLLIISGTPGAQIEGNNELPEGDYYYEWRNNRLRLIRRVLRPSN